MSITQQDILSETSNSGVYPGVQTSVSLGSGMSSLNHLRASYNNNNNSSSPVFVPHIRPQSANYSSMGASRVQNHQRNAFSSFQPVRQPLQGSAYLHPQVTVSNHDQSNQRRVTHGNQQMVGNQQLVSSRIISSHNINTAQQSQNQYGGPQVYTSRGGSRQISMSPSVTHHSVIGNSSAYTASGQKIIADYTTEKYQNNQHKVLVEETYEEVVVVPHKKIVERIVDEPECIRQRIVEVECPQVVERVVEVPEVEYVEVEVPHHETITMDNVIMQPKIETVERIVEVPVIVYREKVVQEIKPEYHEVEYETIVEYPEEHIETKIIPKFMPKYVDVDVPEIVDVTVEEDVDLQFPVPVEHEVHVQLKFPRITAKYNAKEVPVYVPRFVEVPVPMDLLDDVSLLQVQEASSMLESLQQSEGPVTLAQIEEVVRNIVSQDWSSVFGKDAASHPWQTNFLASQIPVVMDSVVQVTEDIKNLGFSQAGPVDQEELSESRHELESEVLSSCSIGSHHDVSLGIQSDQEDETPTVSEDL
eukprot:GHVH01002917.1.p2 GENE.GHVH01002917.1~~GHVH01002917.1.p2  ORF type:complete len:531 (-),score=80.70 GHVH01002917.1:115-1707(-)